MLRALSASSRPTFEEVFHALAKEPFNLPPSEWRHLTPYQVRHIFFRPEKPPTSRPVLGPPPSRP